MFNLIIWLEIGQTPKFPILSAYLSPCFLSQLGKYHQNTAAVAAAGASAFEMWYLWYFKS